MTGYSRGDVVLVEFVFSDESGRKVRPPLVLSSPADHRSPQEAIVAAITGNVRRPLFGDHPVADWREAGLLFPSLVTGILRTVKLKMIDRGLGTLRTGDMETVGREIRRSLGL